MNFLDLGASCGLPTPGIMFLLASANSSHQPNVRHVVSSHLIYAPPIKSHLVARSLKRLQLAALTHHLALAHIPDPPSTIQIA